MKNYKQLIGILFILLFTLSTSYMYADIKTDPVTNEETVGVLATINGDPITLMDVLKICGMEEARLPYMYQGYELQEQLRKLRKQALEKVIERQLIYNDFVSKGFNLPMEYMENYLDKIAESFNVNDQKALKALVESKGQSYEEFKKDAYKNAAIEALTYDKCYRGVFITPKQTYEYYKNHEKDFVTPEEIELQILELRKKGMHKKELDSLTKTLEKTFNNADKRTFDDAVLMYSEGPERQNGGDIGWIEKDKLRNDFKEYMGDIKKGEIIGPIKTSHAYFFLRIADIRSRKVEEYKDAKENIRKMLTEKAKEKQYKEYIKSLKHNAYIKYFI